MKHNNSFFIGIDVSKLWFDASVMTVANHQKQPIDTQRFDNDPKGLKVFEKWLRARKVTFTENTLLVMENTGVYHRQLWAFCTAKKLPVHIGNAAHIKWSFGIARGKNDKIDSLRLCSFAQKHAEELKATPVLDPVLMQLRDLMTARTRLLSQVNANKMHLRELDRVSEKSVHQTLEKAYKTAIKGIGESIKSMEGEIKRIVAANEGLRINYDLLVSVPGIGHLTAVYLVCCTNNFAGGISGKQLACYAGVVPFEHSSGTSVRGKSRVHKMANKDLKKLLHLCALSAIRYESELKSYYERKKEEGKHSMSVLNAIRNKIVLRAVAVINNRKPYVDHTAKAA